MSVTLYGGDSVNLTTGVVTRAPNLTPNGHATLSERLRAESIKRLTHQNDLRALAHILRTNTNT